MINLLVNYSLFHVFYSCFILMLIIFWSFSFFVTFDYLAMNLNDKFNVVEKMIFNT